MTELLRLVESGLSLQAGETLALLGGSRDLPLSLVRRAPLARHVAAIGIVDLTRVPMPGRRFAYIGAQDGLAPRKNVAFNVAPSGHPAPGAIAAALELVGLIGIDQQPVASLTRYDRQRVALARALAAAPRLLVLARSSRRRRNPSSAGCCNASAPPDTTSRSCW